MKPLRSEEIQGTWASVLLPINRDESIDFARLTEDIDYLVTTGVDGIYTNGTAGEFYSQTEAEFDRLHAVLAERCEKAQLPFQIGASHMDPQISLTRVRRAVQLRPSAIQVILPDWFPLRPAEALIFLKRIAEAASPVGLILYNPPHSKRTLQPEEYGQLANAVPALVGVKVAADLDWYAHFKTHAPGLSLFVPGHQLATGVKTGATGSYSNIACLHPKGAKRWNERMHTDYSAALATETRIASFLQRYLLPLRDQHGYSNQALDKLLAAIGGWSTAGTRLRWPYRWIDPNEVRRLSPLALRELPELFPPFP